MATEKGMNRKKMDGATEISRRGPHLPWPLLAVNFVLMALILVAGFLYTRQQISRIKTDKMNELRAIAELKTGQVRHWLNEILDNGCFLRSNMNFNAMFMEKLKIKPADFQKFLSTWIKTLKDSEGFAEIRFLHLQFRPVWSAAEETKPADPTLVRELQTVFAAEDVSLFDLYFSKTLNRINLSLRVPVFTFSVFGQVLQAVLLFSVDPSQFLFPLIKSWPTASPSAETLLVRREGDDVVYLNELRHRQNTALRLRYPIDKKEIPAARAARGEVGFVTGLDYRGVPVFADIHRIPGTSWSLIAKIDQTEVHDLVTHQVWVMFVLAFSVFLVILLFSAYSWRRQQVSYLRCQVTTDAALRQSEERYRQLVENLGEGICIINQDENFVFVNPAAEKIFGVTPGTLAGRNLKGFLPAAELSRLEEQNRKRAQGEKGGYELRICRPDGAERVLLITTMSLKDPKGEVSGAFGIFRDISDRKRDEEKIRKMLAEKELLLKEVHHRVKNNMMVIGSLLQIQVQRINDPKTITVLQESQNRIRAMMIIYEKLYQTTNLTHIGLGDYFSELIRSLFAAYNVHPGALDLETAISDITLDIDRTIPCALIINELVSNTLKYAFPDDRKGRIKIEFRESEVVGRGTPPCGDKSRLAAPTEQDRAPMYALTVANDGVPLPAGFDITKSTGFGLQLVNMLAGQLGGKLQVHSREWMEFRFTFPKNQ